MRHTTRRLNYLSAQCPFGTGHHVRSNCSPVGVSITFRLSALSALDQVDAAVHGRGESLNYLSAQCPFGTSRAHKGEPAREYVSLNYLSAQCPFGTSNASSWRGEKAKVSITFRLSALSAPTAENLFSWAVAQVSITFRLSALSARARGTIS